MLIAIKLLDSPVPYRPDAKPPAKQLRFETPGALYGLREGVLPGDGMVVLLLPCAPAQA